MEKVVSLFVILAMLSACKKDEAVDTVIRGSVITYGTTTPLVGVKLTLTLEQRGGGGLGLGGGGTNYNGEITSVTTDEQGRFSFRQDCYRDRGDYWLYIETPPGHFGPVSKVQIWPGEDNYVPYDLLGEAVLKLQLKNINPFDVHDQIAYALSTFEKGSFIGYGIDVTIFKKIHGNKANYLHYLSKKIMLFHPEMIHFTPC